MYKYMLSVITLLLFGCSSGQNNPDKTQLSAVEFSQKINELGAPQLIDVRTPEEFEGGHLLHAVNFNWNSDDFMKKVASLDKTKPVFVYCLSGGRSASAAATMRKNGFREVYEMDGGMMQWRARQLPEVNGAPLSDAISVNQYNTLIDSEKLVLIDFYAEWCVPCKKMEPYLNKITEDSKEYVTVIRIDADKNPDLCRQLNVTALPVLKLYKNKELIWDNLGFVEEGKVREQLTTNR